MILLVVGEGSRDVGDERYEGDIPLLVANILGRRFSCRRATLGELPRTHGGIASKLAAAIAMGNQQNPATDGVVFVVDCPLGPHRERRRELVDARNAIRLMRVALGLAIHEIEAWLLADPEARRAGMDEEHARRTYAQPEEDPDPKTTYASFLGEALAKAAAAGAVDLDDFERRRLLIAAMRPNVVAQLCPEGFAPFADEVRRLPTR